jgi:hypothetical protein
LDDSQKDVAVFYLVMGKFPTDEFIDEKEEIEIVEPIDMHYFTGQKVCICIYKYIHLFNIYTYIYIYIYMFIDLSRRCF